MGRASAEPLPSAAESTPRRAGALFAAEICAAGRGDMGVIREYAKQAVALSQTLGDDKRLALSQGLGAGALAGWSQASGAQDEDSAARAHALSARRHRHRHRGSGPEIAGPWRG